MQWSGDRNAGFSRANPQKLYLPVIIDPEYHYESVNVEAEQANSSSLLWWMKRLIALRKQYRAFGRGSIEFLRPDNPKILAFIRRFESEIILVVATLSRFVQYVELNLGEFRGQVPYELFGRTPFPPIGELPYLLTIGPHGFYWFSLGPAPVRTGAGVAGPREVPVPRINLRDGWEELLEPARWDALERAIKAYLRESVLLHGKLRIVRDVTVRHALRLPFDVPSAIVLVDAEFLDAETELRALRLGYAPAGAADAVPGWARIATLTRTGQPDGVLFDARTDPEFCAAVLQGIAGNRSLPFADGELVATRYPQFDSVCGPDEVPQPITLLAGEQHNVSVVYGNRLILKSFERLEPGVNPDLELGRFLTDHTTYSRAAPVVGAIELRPHEGEPYTLGVLSVYVPNEGDAWKYTLGVLSRFYETVLADPRTPPPPAPPLARTPGVALPPPEEARDLLDAFLPMAEKLGRYTAEMHRALASSADDPAVAPEPFTKHYQRSV
jgi:maltose alpha-D-glucosyltransferase/alpha-amylase